MLRPGALGLKAEHEIQAYGIIVPGHGNGSRDGSVTTQRLRCNEMFAATLTEGICVHDLKVVGYQPGCAGAAVYGPESCFCMPSQLDIQ